MHRSDNRIRHCEQEARLCAQRATRTVSAEIREAYLQLELGWRQLVPKVAADEAAFGGTATMRDEADAQPAAAAVVGT